MVTRGVPRVTNELRKGKTLFASFFERKEEERTQMEEKGSLSLFRNYLYLDPVLHEPFSAVQECYLFHFMAIPIW